MANSLVALGVQQPQINTLAAFDQSQANELQNKSTRMAQARQGLEWVGSMALGAMGGKLDGEADPARWEEGISMLAGQVDDSVLQELRARPDLAPVIARASLDTMQQLSVANSDRDYELALKRFDQQVAEAADASQHRAWQRDQASQPDPGFTLLTPDEVQAAQLPPGSYQRGPDNKIYEIGGGGQTINIGGEPADGKLRGALDAAEGKLWSDYKAAGTVSAGNAQDFEVLGELIEIAPQGAIPGRLANMFQGMDSASDAFNSIVKRVAPTLRAPGSGSTSDIEYDGMLRGLPSLLTGKEGNRMILSIMDAKADINMKRAEVVTQYQTGDLTAAEARKKMNELDRKSIITPEMRKALDGLGGGQAPASDVPDGVDPSLWSEMTPEEKALWN